MSIVRWKWKTKWMWLHEKETPLTNVVHTGNTWCMVNTRYTQLSWALSVDKIVVSVGTEGDISGHWELAIALMQRSDRTISNLVQNLWLWILGHVHKSFLCEHLPTWQRGHVSFHVTHSSYLHSCCQAYSFMCLLTIMPKVNWLTDWLFLHYNYIIRHRCVVWSQH